MKLIDGIKIIKGRGSDIPDCSRDDLPELFKELGLKRGVEIGVYEAKFTEVLAKSGLEIYGVDPWRNYDDYDNLRNKEVMDNQYEKVKEKLGKYDNCKIIRETSMEALSHFDDDSIDFVYIDGNHWYKFVTEDIYEWSKKVREGGIICGHDFYYKAFSEYSEISHVPFVVESYARANEIKNWWLLGSKNPKEGEKRDTCRSWMWIRPKRIRRTK